MAAGSSGAQALRNTLDLARMADGLGFTRYWVAEHHNMASIASSAPDIMIGQIAAATSRMRVGSGGVMLPNHAPLMVAERFKVLEALFPGRIDLGLGRAPGTDQVTSYLLRRRQGISEEDDFLDRFNELMLLETRGFPASHPFSTVQAMPSDVRAAADLSAGLVRLQRATGRPDRRGFCVRASLRDLSGRRSDAALPRQLSGRRRRTTSLTPFSAPMWCAPTPTTKPNGWRRPST